MEASEPLWEGNQPLGAQTDPVSLLPTPRSPPFPACCASPSPHLLNEPDDADGLLLAKGQGAGQAVELPRELEGRKAIRGLGHAGAGGVTKGLPGAAGWVQGIQGNAARWRGKAISYTLQTSRIPWEEASTLSPSPHHAQSAGPNPSKISHECAPVPPTRAPKLGRPPDLMSLWRKRQLFLRLAELPRQQVTSPYSCMILIISHMAEGAESGSTRVRRLGPCVRLWAETHRVGEQEMG